jgi:hypothetical protein
MKFQLFVCCYVFILFMKQIDTRRWHSHSFVSAWFPLSPTWFVLLCFILMLNGTRVRKAVASNACLAFASDYMGIWQQAVLVIY